VRKLRTKARALPGSHEWGFAGTGAQQVGLRLQAIGGDLDGQFFTWYGYFTERSEDRTLEQLQIAGWDGNDIINLPGIGSTEFDLQLEEQEDEESGQTFLKPTFINRIGVAMKNVMNPMEKAAFAARMRAKTGAASPRSPAPGSAGARSQHRAAPRAASGGGGWDTSAPPPGDDDIPF